MHLHPFPHPLLFILIIFLVIVHVPISLCNDDERFLNCSRPFECGNIRSIMYPFWGRDRPSYCGHPGFELKCQDDIPEIQIMSERYRVLGISSESQTLKVARDDFWNNTCPTRFANTTLNFTLFNYAPSVQNLTLYYSCTINNISSIPTTSQFKCPVNHTTLNAFYATRPIPSEENIWKCNVSVIVPVLETAAAALETNATTVLETNAMTLLHQTALETNAAAAPQTSLTCSATAPQTSLTCPSPIPVVIASPQPASPQVIPVVIASPQPASPQVVPTVVIASPQPAPPQTNYVPYETNATILGAALDGGFELQWTIGSAACNQCLASGGQCGYDSNSGQPICFCRHQPYAATCLTPGNDSTKKKLIIVASTTTIFVVIIIFCCLRFKSSLFKSVVFWKDSRSAQNVEVFLKDYGSLVLKRYKYSDIKKMTDSFKNKLGQGGYGGVFKGKLPVGRMVAVKLLSESKGNGEEFINEVASISRTSHVNIVSLLGFCVEGAKRALIYEFMPNGSLEKFIYDEKPLKNHPHLGWEKLYQIAIGIAQGLEYLHRGCNTRILHFDIKPHNILLDEDFCPKISDFGLAKICPKKESIISMMGTRGTPGYIAPEVLSRNFGGVSHKSDVYSYGMMILEMVGGRKNIDAGVDNISEIYFPDWIYKHLHLSGHLGLSEISTEVDEEIARKMIIVGLWCIQSNPSDRPSMNKVLEMLEGSLGSLSIPPKP